MLGILYILFVFSGWLLLLPYTKQTKRFIWKEYLLMMAVPLVGLTGLVYMEGLAPMWVFLIGTIVGPAVEHLAGWFYHKINGAHLWVYERLSLPGRYTSFLVAPMWGCVFVMIWSITKAFN